MKFKMTEQEIQEYAKGFLKKAYGLDLEIPVSINGRLTRTLGRFIRVNNHSDRIEMSKQFIQRGELNDIKSTIKHECIHYALFELGRDHRDGQDDFESELIKHGSHSTRTVQVAMKRNINIYKCSCDTHKRVRALRNNGRGYSCNSCKSSLKFIGKKSMLV